MDNKNENEKKEYVDEDSGILIEEFLKIHDPVTGDVSYEGRT